MIEILNTKLPTDKRLVKVLTLIYGINKQKSYEICQKIGLNQNKKLNACSTKQLNFLKKYIENHYKNETSYNLYKKIKFKIDMLITLKTYRGMRHKKRLPVRGQRTRSNGRTQKKMKNASYRGE